MSAISHQIDRLANPSAKTTVGGASFKRILVAFDSSEQASWALSHADALALQLGGELVLVNVTTAVSSTAIDEAKHRLTVGTSQVTVGVQVEQQFRDGDPAQQIIAAANEWDADLIVLGTHARRGIKRMVLGSVAAAVVKDAPCATLCVSQPPATSKISRILVPVDHSQQAYWAMHEAVRLANSFSAAVILLHVTPFPGPMEPGYGFAAEEVSEAIHDNAMAFLDRFHPHLNPGLILHCDVRQGATADQILVAARAWEADLIVMGAFSKHGIARLALGNSADQVLRHATCPVLCVSHDRTDAGLTPGADPTHRIG